MQVAGSSTVFPVANAWANGVQNVSNFAITIEGGQKWNSDRVTLTNEFILGKHLWSLNLRGGGSSTGARRVCKDRADPDHASWLKEGSERSVRGGGEGGNDDRKPKVHFRQVEQ